MRLVGKAPDGVPVVSYVGGPDGFVIGGLPGRAATVAVGSTTTGAAGTSASVSNSGSSNAAVLNFTVPAGAIGPQGAPGTPGSATLSGLDAFTLSRRVSTLGNPGALTQRWTRILSIASTGPYQTSNCLLAISTLAIQNNETAIISVGSGNNAPGQAPSLTLNVIAASGAGYHIAADSFKLISNGEFLPTELWFKSVGPYSGYSVYEISRAVSGMVLTYDSTSAWQAATPVGTAVNVPSNGVTAFGVPLVSTTGSQTLSNKTLAQPAIVDSLGNNVAGIVQRANAVNYIQFRATEATGSPCIFAVGADSNVGLLFGPKGSGSLQIYMPPGQSTAAIDGAGAGSNIDLDLRSKGTGVVKANNIPVATTTGAQTVTNKTISGASNTITNLPAASTPLAARLVCTTNVSVANNWTKVATFAPGSNPYYAQTLKLQFVALTYGTASVASVAIQFGNEASGANPRVAARMIERTGASFADDFLKVVGGSYGTDFEVWIKWPSSGAPITVYEMGRYDNLGALTYHTLGAWQATEPTGAVNNVKTAGLELTSPRVNQILDTNGNIELALSPRASAVNYLTIGNNAAGASPEITAAGSDTNLNVVVTPKGTGALRVIGGNITPGSTDVNLNLSTLGTGTVQANGLPVGVKVAVPATATSTGVVGQWAADASWHYVCTAANTWRRAALATW
jgi:hypothetical protein